MHALRRLATQIEENAGALVGSLIACQVLSLEARNSVSPKDMSAMLRLSLRCVVTAL